MGAYERNHKVNKEGILDLMRKYFEKEKPKADFSNFGQTPASAILVQSIDTVEFLIFLETELDLEEDALDLERFGPQLAGKSFGEIAGLLEGFLSKK
jgi:hypothetical protein